MCFQTTPLLIVMDDGSDTRQTNTLSRTSLRNIVLRSSLARFQGRRLNFVHLNPGSAVQHIGEMNDIFKGVDVQLIAVSETWFKMRHTNRHVGLDGFRVIRADRGGGRRGGGVALYLRENLRYKVVARSTPTSVVDYLFIELRLPYPILVCVIYNPPNINGFSVFGPELEPLISKYSDVLILGDFNHDVLRSDGRVSRFLEDLKNLNLHVHSNSPTNFQGQPSCIDLVVTNRPECVQFFNQIDLPGIPTTHDLIYGSYSLPNCPDPGDLPKFFRDYKNLDIEALMNDVSNLDWSNFFAADDVNVKLHIFNSFLLSLFERHVRLKRSKIVNKVNPWFNVAIEKAMRERDICYAVWKARKTDGDKARLKLIRRKVTRLVRNAKRSYMAKFLNPSLPSRVLWKNLRSVGAAEDKLDAGPIIFSPDELNNYYSSDVVRDLPNTNTNSSTSNQSDHFIFRTVSFFDVKKAIRSVKSNAVGLDEIPLKFIKLILPGIISPIAEIFNKTISSRSFPSAWKFSKIVPVAKVKDPCRLKDYRPISILPALSKALEKIMKDQIVSFCNERGLLNQFQSGFRSGHSTTTALLKITDDVAMDMDKNLMTILVLLDFSKAFDTVNFKLLCQKLRNLFRFSESAIKLIKSYLTGRSQCVFANGALSSFLPVTQGVPQGSILGPLLFSLFINDISSCIKFSNYHIYADDVQIYLSGREGGIASVINQINSDLASVSHWSTENGLCLNSQKTQVMAIHRNPCSVLPPVKIGDTIMPYSTKVKNLGVIMNCNLTWNDQISSIVSGVNGALSRLWCTANFTPVETRRKLVVALLLPKFQYCDILFSQSSVGNRDRLNKCYNSCARYVYNIRSSESISGPAKNITGRTLDQLLEFRICSFFHKIIQQRSPGYLFEKLRFGHSQRTGVLIPPRHNHTSYGNSFFVEGVSLWNSLPSDIRSSRSLEAFKRSYLAHSAVRR
jgi:Reverse transcriptase (RNA-dependent DNA polymerase)